MFSEKLYAKANSPRSQEVEFEKTLAQLKTICQVSAAKPHAATYRQDVFGRKVVTVHAAKSASSAAELKDLGRQLRSSDITARIHVRTHSDRQIAKARSLEQFLKIYDDGVLAFDPTGAFARAEDLLNFANIARSEIGEKRVAGIYWHAQWRTVYVVLDHTEYFRDEKVKTIHLDMAEKAARAALRLTCGSEFVRGLRIGFELPAVLLVPVDNASLIEKSDLLSSLAKYAKVPAVTAMLGLGGAMVAGQAAAESHVDTMSTETMAAVTGINAKIAIVGGWIDGMPTPVRASDGTGGIVIDDSTAIFGIGSVTIPIGTTMGLQIDGIYGRVNLGEVQGKSAFTSGNVDENMVSGVGGHLFWRDPLAGLIGLTASRTWIDGTNPGTFLSGTAPNGSSFGADQSAFAPDRTITRFGAEGELYLDQFTLAAAAGWQRTVIDFDPAVFGPPKSTNSGFYGSVDFGWYASDDLKLSIGAATNPDTDVIGLASVEWAPAFAGVEGLTLFADGKFGTDDYQSIMLGVRMYFGQSATLKARHRYDDPTANLVYDTFNTTAGGHFNGY